VHLKTNCDEKGTATKEGFQFKSFIETHPMGGLGFLSMLDEDLGSKRFFRCGSPFVAKFRVYSHWLGRRHETSPAIWLQQTSTFQENRHMPPTHNPFLTFR
jgi:hypothetical protein